MSNSVFNDDATIDSENVQYVLTDEQAEKMKMIFEALKKKSGSERVHIVDEDDFETYLTNYVKIIGKRLEKEQDMELCGSIAIALVDNGKSGTGKRGIWVTKIGVFVLEKDYPKLVDGEERGGLIPWPLFFHFACEEVIDDADDAGEEQNKAICLMDAYAVEESSKEEDGVSLTEEVFASIGKDDDGDILGCAWNWEFWRTDIDPDDAVVAVKAMKEVVSGQEGCDEDDEAEDAEEAEEADE